MLKYILQRIGLMMVTMFIIISATFVLLQNIPNSEFDDPMLDETLKAVLITQYGLDRPVHERYFMFIGNILRGNLGTSTRLYPRQNVYAVIMERLPISMQLSILSSFMTYPMGLFLGILMAIKKNTSTDHFLSVFVVFFISVPGFVIAALLQYFLAHRLGWFPLMLSTDRPHAWVFPAHKIHSMLLPALALSFGSIMGIARSMRGELSEALTSDFMLLAKTKGLTHTQATLRHALRNSFVPMTGMIVGVFLSVFTGSLIIESFFGIPGVGGMLIRAISVTDTPMIIGWMLMYTAMGLAGIIITDLLYGVVDPRIRIGGRKSEA